MKRGRTYYVRARMTRWRRPNGSEISLPMERGRGRSHRFNGELTEIYGDNLVFLVSGTYLCFVNRFDLIEMTEGAREL